MTHTKVTTVLESMEEMESIHLENLKNPYHREFIKDTLKVAKMFEAVVQNLARQLAALEEAFEEEQAAALIEETIQNLTKEVYDLADVRSLGQTALKAAIRGVMGLPGEPEKVATAEKMFNLMHKYDLHTGMNVDEQTAVIDSFILDVETNYPEAMATIGLTALYNQLKEQNEAVCNKVIERDLAKRGFGTGRMENARAAVDAAWRHLRRGVNAESYLNGCADYAGFISYMNVLIERYKRNYIKQNVSSPEAEPGEELPGIETPGETNPGEGTGGTETPGGTPTPTTYTLTFTHNGQVVSTQQLAPGAAITAPTAPSGYQWADCPAVMPARDLTVTTTAVSGGGNTPPSGGNTGEDQPF